MTQTAAQTVAIELLHMNKDALAALVTLGANSGAQDPLFYITDLTDRFVVENMLSQAYRRQTQRAEPPYPFCRTPAKCAGKGYCPRDIACND